MNLKTLLEKIEPLKTEGSLNVEVNGIQYDSRRVAPGNVFVAVKGARTDGHKFVDQAVAQGAVAVVLEDEGFFSGRATTIRVSDSTEALGKMAAVFHGHPSRSLQVIGVTGTNGKTTFTFLLKSILESHGMKTGLLGTIRYELGGRQLPADRTTPQSSDLQQLFAQMKNAGCGAVVMEVSSHSLVQKRVEGIDFDVAVFTNLTQDHLDYHGTMDEYFNAKSILFTGLGKGAKPKAAAVINLQDPRSSQLRQMLDAGIRCLTYGHSERADIQASNIRLSLNGAQFRVATPEGDVEASIQLCGRYNVDNALAALAAALALEIPLETAVLGLGKMTSVPGRLEAVREGQPFHVFVDYAHTDDALKNVLSTLRELVKGRLIVVFGCGGNRDAGKRPLMGRVASELADHVVITSDNPRKEDPAEIIRQIESGFLGSATRETVIDRKEAIEHAIKQAREGDVVLIAGKGHETYQEFADTRVPFDDRECAANLLKQQIWQS